MGVTRMGGASEGARTDASGLARVGATSQFPSHSWPYAAVRDRTAGCRRHGVQTGTDDAERSWLDC